VVGGWLTTTNYPTTNQSGGGTLHAFPPVMRFLKLYLVGYFILLIGAGMALWQSGVLRQIPGIWLGIAAIIAIGLGIMLAVASGRPAVTTRE
jgi:hypothetical protein